MPGTRPPKHSGIVSALALAALLALPGCYARKPIPLDAPAARTQPLEAAPAPAKAEPEKPAQAAPAPAQAPAPEQAAAAQAEPAAPAPAQAIQEKDLTDAPAAQTAPAAKAAGQSYVQIGAFGTEANAQGALTWLKEKGYGTARLVRVEQGGAVLFRVQAGPFQDLAAAHKALEVLKPDWPQAFIPVD